MTCTFYKEMWNGLSRFPDLHKLERLSRQIAYSFLDRYLKDCHYQEDYIELLCEMTTFSEDPELNAPGAHALFSIIVESLCDDFEELQTDTYNRVMAQVITYCSRIPAGRELARRLRDFGIYTADDVLNRIKSIRANGNHISKQNIQKILLLSRVTIGADIAITSIIIQRLGHIFPAADIVLIGNKKLTEMYGAHPRVIIRDVSYSRRGGLLERLSSWHLVLDVISQETKTYSSQSVILIDPDSRLSQLGILPLLPLQQYYFFDSRSDNIGNMSMPELTNAWLDRILENSTDQTDFSYPRVWVPGVYLNTAQKLCDQLRKNGTKRIIAVNFGVGGNLRKRVSTNFEKKLLLLLLKTPQTTVLLDKGFGKEEGDYIDALLEFIRKNGHPTHDMPFADDAPRQMVNGIIGIRSTIGEMAGLIAHCDEFIGYDSACQHISAALKTPCITIFAGSNNMRFIRRWSAHGPQPNHIVHVDTLSNPTSIDEDDIITRIMHTRTLRFSGSDSSLECL